MSEQPTNPPESQANEGSPFNGVVPPPQHRFKPGKSGNPAGRPSAGLSIVEWLNAMRAWPESKVRRASQSKQAPWCKRAAAEQILRAIEHGDLADFEPVIRGEKTLDELRKAGINTEIVKKLKTKRRVTKDGDEETEAEIELHNRGGENFASTADRIDGRPIDMGAEQRLTKLERAFQEKHQ